MIDPSILTSDFSLLTSKHNHMKILVLGAGRMGHGAVFDLIHNSPEVEAVTVADFHLEKAEAVAASVGGNVTARQIDASKQRSRLT